MMSGCHTFGTTTRPAPLESLDVSRLENNVLAVEVLPFWTCGSPSLGGSLTFSFSFIASSSSGMTSPLSVTTTSRLVFPPELGPSFGESELVSGSSLHNMAVLEKCIAKPRKQKWKAHTRGKIGMGNTESTFPGMITQQEVRRCQDFTFLTVLPGKATAAAQHLPPNSYRPLGRCHFVLLHRAHMLGLAGRALPFPCFP